MMNWKLQQHILGSPNHERRQAYVPKFDKPNLQSYVKISPRPMTLSLGFQWFVAFGSAVVLLKEAQEQNYLKIMILVN
jgi:hypothetical protein